MHKNKVIYIVVFSIILLFSSSNIGYANTANILADNLNVRSGPGTNFETIGKVHSQESYPVIQRQDDWVEIQLEHTTGWVTAQYVSINEDLSNEAQPPSVTKIKILANNIQVRSGPSVNDDILFFAKKGENFDVISQINDWYEIKNEQQSGFIHKNLINNNDSFKSQGLKDKVFVIDAGHGGYDVGAVSVSGIYEKDLTLRTANELKDALNSLGAKVILTRENDEFIRLGSRVSLANLVDPNVFISIHYNSFPESPTAAGIVSHYYDQRDEELAKHIHQQTVQITGTRDRDTLFGDFQVLRHTFNQAVLLELGFMSNVEEEQLLLTDQYQKKLVRGIVNGLIKYYSSN